MIGKREILEAASSFQLLPNVVEKDYVLGWLLAGIHAHPEFADAWVFKGGTCLKKCYFETYRFSEDLDFTLRDESQLDAEFLRRVMGEVAAWVADESGLVVPVDQIVVDLYTNPRGRQSCQGKIGYRGPISPTARSGGWPKIKLDLTADERLVLPAASREVFHPYSDRPEGGFWANCYAYDEAFAEKVRALGERTRPRDLYDVVNLYRRIESRPSPAVLLDVLGRKCSYKGVAIPSVASIMPHRTDLEAMWGNMLGHQLPVLPPVADFWSALLEFFEWIAGAREAPQRAHIASGGSDVTVRSRVLPMAVPIGARAPLEIIRFAAANHLCVDLTYGGSVRRIEPYSLRQSAEGNFLLHAVKRDSGEHRSYRVDRMQGASVTEVSFVPRYVVELTPEGPLPVASTASPQISSNASPRRSNARQRSRRAKTSMGGGPSYVFRCTLCGKTFERKSMDGTLNPHKHPNGYACPGRVGTYVRTKY